MGVASQLKLEWDVALQTKFNLFTYTDKIWIWNYDHSTPSDVTDQGIRGDDGGPEEGK